MKAAKVELRDAERVKSLLLEQGFLDCKFLPKKEREYIYFPLIDEEDGELPDYVTIVETELSAKVKKVSVDDKLAEFLKPEEMEQIPRSQEIIGDILILEIPESLNYKEKEIAQAYLESSHTAKVVVKKTAVHSGQFRTRGVEVLAGEDRKETTHLESGVRLFMNIEETYFSARLGNERLRIAKLVQPGENVLVMFSGSAPYPLVLAKHTEAKKIVGVELNPHAHGFAIMNRDMNKVPDSQVNLINGDVRVEVPRLKEKFDRVLMPLPKTSEEFLDVALPVVKSGGIIHLYAFLNERDIVNEGENIIDLCEEMGFEVELVDTVKCGQHAPYVFRVCFDIKVY